MGRRDAATLLVECGMRVLAWALTENQTDRPDRSFRCVRGLAINAMNGKRWGDKCSSSSAVASCASP